MFRSLRYSFGNAMNVGELLQKLVLDAILIFEMLHLANVNSTNRFDSVAFCWIMDVELNFLVLLL